MNRLASALNYTPLGLSREEAAQHIGIGTTLFDEMVVDGRMPRPKIINSRRIWDRIKIEQAFAALPSDGPSNNVGEWDSI